MTPAKRAFRALYCVWAIFWAVIGIAHGVDGSRSLGIHSLILAGVIFLVGRSAETMER